MQMIRSLAAATLAVLVGTAANAAPPVYAAASAEALDLAKKAIALRSVAGPGNQTPAVAALYRSALLAGGFLPQNVTITRVDDTAYLIATWPGTDKALKPLVISGHMDVVEAKPADWQRNPFSPIVEHGYLFGRGSTDMKLDGTIAIAALTELHHEGYKPRRTIVIEFSGDEETTMKTGAIIAEKLANSELVLNMDGAGGVLNEQTNAQEYFTWKGAEKTYGDYRLAVTNPGGHSSEPRKPNAIYELAAALIRIGNYQFTPELNDLTRAYLQHAAAYETPAIAAAMKAFAADPTNKQAIATLTANPATIGKIGTTCVATMISGGHALNALPQRAEANVNCRIFPGHSRPAILAELQKVVADPAITITDVTAGSVSTDASPLRPDVQAAITKALSLSNPGVPVFPAMSSGASDSMWFRYHHVPSYGISPLFIKSSDDFAHGLNERTPIASIPPAVTYCVSLFHELSQ